jgi:signal transduction histidine kinase
MARLTITDTGLGIASEDRERLFAPYFSTRKNGTGLGLAIASRIVADHGGYIGVEPNTPKGTRFVIELPVCQESSLSMTSQASDNR